MSESAPLPNAGATPTDKPVEVDAQNLSSSLLSPVEGRTNEDDHAREAAFKAGYHCRWHREQGAYCFDPAMSPGDPDGAYAAWLKTDAKENE